MEKSIWKLIGIKIKNVCQLKRIKEKEDKEQRENGTKQTETGCEN